MGFKKGISWPHAIYSFRKVVDRYTVNGSTVNVCTLDLSKAFDKVNHSALLVKLMNRNVPVNLLMLLEYWFANSRSCVRWGSNSSEFYRLTAGVRQGGALSPCLFALYVNDVIIKVTSCGIGCHLGFACVNIILYTDDILLLVPSISSLQALLYICESELNSIDMIINDSKSNCLRIGPCWNCDVTNVKLATRNGASIEWSADTCWSS